MKIGLHVQSTTEDMAFVRDVVAKGIAKNPDAEWRVFETDRVAREILAEHDIEPVLLKLDPAWLVTDENGVKLHDSRRLWRDYELMACDQCVVFQREGASTPWTERAKNKAEYRIHENLFVIEVGKPKARKRARRKPVGA